MLPNTVSGQATATVVSGETPPLTVVLSAAAGEFFLLLVSSGVGVVTGVVALSTVKGEPQYSVVLECSGFRMILEEEFPMVVLAINFFLF
jgi:hypothetical protein